MRDRKIMTPAFPFMPGLKLKGDMLEEFTESGVTCIRPWGPRAGAWKKEADGGWRPIRPSLSLKLPSVPPLREPTREAISAFEFPPPVTYQLTIPFSDPEEAAARRRAKILRKFLGLIPREARILAARFPQRHWHVLQLLNRCGLPAYELAEDCPALAFLIANNWVFGPRTAWTMRTARRLVRIRRRDALRWLGFPGHEAAARLMRRIPSRSVTVQRALYLRDALKDDLVQSLLAHVPRINASVIRIATDPRLRDAATPRLLTELGQDRREDRRSVLARRLLEVIWYRQLFSQVPATYGTVRGIAADHEEMIHAFQTSGVEHLRTFTLPPPPVSGTASIVPVRDVVELVREGRDQHHCVATYTLAVVRGEMYIYRVLAPERATLSIRRCGTCWEIDQLEKACNQPVSPETWGVTNEWLRSAQTALNPFL